VDDVDGDFMGSSKIFDTQAMIILNGDGNRGWQSGPFSTD
jgi:hypothetical protein